MSEEADMTAAQLDYAFLADFAQVAEGKITAVGASFTHVRVASFPMNFPISIAGRIRVGKDTQTVAMSIRITPEAKTYEIELDGLLSTKDSRPYGSKIGVLFALTTQVFVAQSGLYQVEVMIEGVLSRTLKFDVGSR